MSDNHNHISARCPECGFKMRQGLRSCPMCGASMLARPAPRAVRDADFAGGNLTAPVADPLTVQLTGTVSPPSRTAANRPPAHRAGGDFQCVAMAPGAAASNLPLATAPRGADVTGRVIAIEHSHTEPPGFDVCRALTCRALTKLLWFLLLFPVVAALAVPLILLRFFSGTDLLWLGFIFRGNGRASEQVPVWYARVRRDNDDGEVMVRLKGAYSTGNVGADDLVSFWGTWRDGVLVAKRGFNHRTRSWIAFQRSRWPILLVLTLAVAVGLALLAHAALSHSISQVPR